jgi:hypothetical protein
MCQGKVAHPRKAAKNTQKLLKMIQKKNFFFLSTAVLHNSALFQMNGILHGTFFFFFFCGIVGLNSGPTT